MPSFLKILNVLPSLLSLSLLPFFPFRATGIQSLIGRLIEKICNSQFVCQSLLFRRRDEKRKGNTFLQYWRVLFQWKIRYTVFENKILSLSRIFKKDYYFFYFHLPCFCFSILFPLRETKEEKDGFISIGGENCRSSLSNERISTLDKSVSRVIRWQRCQLSRPFFWYRSFPSSRFAGRNDWNGEGNRSLNDDIILIRQQASGNKEKIR